MYNCNRKRNIGGAVIENDIKIILRYYNLGFIIIIFNMFSTYKLYFCLLYEQF
jgi:hypothetical protein